MPSFGALQQLFKIAPLSAQKCLSGGRQNFGTLRQPILVEKDLIEKKKKKKKEKYRQYIYELY
jgi:hypothetical protein